MISQFRSERSFFAVSALLFAAGVTATVLLPSRSGMNGPDMAGMGMNSMGMNGMGMGGGAWTAAAFLGPWLAMTAAMMLPSLVPMLLRYRLAVAARAGSRLGRLTLLAGIGYFLVWAGIGLSLFALGAASLAAQPLVTGLVLLTAGAVQLSPWKIHRLACCRAAPDGPMAPGGGAALRHGVGLGVRCVLSCANLMAVLLALGAMDPGWMGLIGAAITAERIAPAGRQVARVLGAALIGLGMWLILPAVGLI